MGNSQKFNFLYGLYVYEQGAAAAFFQLFNRLNDLFVPCFFSSTLNTSIDRDVMKLIWPMILSLLLIACGGGNGSGDGSEAPRETTPPEGSNGGAESGNGAQQEGQIRLGVVTGATVRFFVYGGSDTPVLTTTSSTLAEVESNLGPTAFAALTDGEKLQQAGRIGLLDYVFEPDTWYLAITEGGDDIDANNDGVIDDMATPVHGQLHALLQGKDINGGHYYVTIVTELLYQGAENSLQGRAAGKGASKAALAVVDANAIQVALNRLAGAMLDFSNDVRAVYTDAIGWWPGAENLQPAFRDYLRQQLEVMMHDETDAGVILQQILAEASTFKFNPYRYDRHITGTDIAGTWLLLGNRTVVAQTDAGQVTQTFQTRDTLRIRPALGANNFSFQLCSEYSDWNERQETQQFVNMTVGIYNFTIINHGQMQGNYAFDSEDVVLDGAFVALKLSQDPEYPLGAVTLTANTIDYDALEGDPSQWLPTLFSNETHPITCFAESQTADPRPSLFNVFSLPPLDQPAIFTLANHGLRVGFADNLLEDLSEVIPGGSDTVPNEGHYVTLLKGTWDEENVISRNEFIAIGGPDLIYFTGLYDDVIELHSSFAARYYFSPSPDMAAPEASGTLLFAP